MADVDKQQLNWRERLAGNALHWLSQALRRTARYQVEGWENLNVAQARGGPIIYVAWHGMTMLLAPFFQQHLDLSRLAIIMPDDWRGASLSVWAQRLGAKAYRLHLEGDATMASARRLALVVRHLRAGQDCYITPDGPDGPAYVVKAGATYLSQKTGAWLVPLGAYTRSGYHLRRWDQYMVPRPFCRVSLVVGPPMTVTAVDDLAAINERLTDQLHRLAAQAAANYYEKGFELTG